MGSDNHPELRGFDSYELTLGDELRGERASMGKSLLDVQRDLRIRADYIDAIENADASAFPFAGFAAGYVRSYARYLGMDSEDVFRRFCEESGFEGVDTARNPAGRAPGAAFGGASGGASGAPSSGARPAAPLKADRIDDSVITNRFLDANRQGAGVSVGAGLRGLASVAMLGALVVGLGYGGWTMLQNLQRVGFAPLPTAPEVQVSAPDFFSPDAVAAARPVSADEEAAREAEETTLASIYATQEVASPDVAPRDGPISSIDPARAGIYAPPSIAATPPAFGADAPRGGERRVIHDDGEVAGIGEVDPSITVALAKVEADAAASATAAAFTPPSGVHVHAEDDAWVRIRDGGGRTLFSGILGPGERFTVPEGAVAAELRAGNAGAVYIAVDAAVFGPLGVGPTIAKKVSLAPEDVKSAFPLSDIVLKPAQGSAEAVALGGP